MKALSIPILLTLLLSLNACKKEDDSSNSSDSSDGRFPRFSIELENEAYGTSEFDTNMSNGVLTVDAQSATNNSYHFIALNGLNEGVHSIGTSWNDNDFGFTYNDGQAYYCHQCEVHIQEHDEDDDFVRLRITGTMKHVSVSVFIELIEAELSTYY